MITKTIILASASPRRAELLRWGGLACTVKPASIDESRKYGEAPVDYALRLAREKALTHSISGRVSLGADTAVFVEDRLFDKPGSYEGAVAHLTFLAGRTHQVVTAFALAEGGKIIHCQAVVSRVTFRPLSREIIELYAATGEGFDTAGAYGLQGWGGFLVESIEGSFTNVVGLPLTELKNALTELYPGRFDSAPSA